MSLIKVNESKQNILKKGAKLIKENEFFKDLSNLMENKEFSNFLQKYMFNSLEIKNSLIYIKIYELVKNKLGLFKDNRNVNKCVVTYILYNIMTNDKYRKVFLKATDDFIEDSKKNEDLFQNLLNNEELFENLIKNEKKIKTKIKFLEK